MSDAILGIRDVSKAFQGVQAVRDVSLDVIRGHVLGLVGQNGAGKSTLMNIVAGVVHPDAGTMQLDGQPYHPSDPAAARGEGVGFIHQELNLFTNLSIAENIFIDRFPRRRLGPLSALDRGEANRITRGLLDKVGLGQSPSTLVDRLSPGERQLVEIAKALQLDARLIILDEPTTSLTARETDRLFALIGQLRESGTTMIYISHILADVLRVADDIAILRDGELVSAGPRTEFDVNRLIAPMIGRALDQLFPPRTTPPTSEPLLEARSLTATGIVRDVSLTIHRGEVLGLFGLMGSGRTELARILFGLDEFDSGSIAIRGREQRSHSPRARLREHVAFITEDRRTEGLMMDLSIADNISLAALPAFASPLRVVDQSRLLEAATDVAGSIGVKAGAIERQPAMSLSGGNQQKVVLARWLLSNPILFLMDEPTRGIDVAAKYDIYTIVDRLAAGGSGVLFISSELEELIAMCDRILVMNRGEIVGEFERSTFATEPILRSAFREASAA
jgi:ABC-type sugar transport system ATPase subunit